MGVLVNTYLSSFTGEKLDYIYRNSWLQNYLQMQVFNLMNRQFSSGLINWWSYLVIIEYDRKIF